MYISLVLDQVMALSAASLVTCINDVGNRMDKRQHCAGLFIDLSKASDTVDHSLLIVRLSSIGLHVTGLQIKKNNLKNM